MEAFGETHNRKKYRIIKHGENIFIGIQVKYATKYLSPNADKILNRIHKTFIQNFSNLK